MKNIVTKLFVSVGLIFCLVLVGCQDDKANNNNTPIDENIPVNDSSTFNMSVFIDCFNQLFVADNRWAWDFNHEINDGKATLTYQNYKIYGKFGQKLFTITHYYDAEGIVSYSERTTSEFVSNVLKFQYVYDLEGRIIQLIKSFNGEVKDIVNLEYNSKSQLIKKTHEALELGREVSVETFSYYEDGTVNSYANDGDITIYEYADGNMIKTTDTWDGGSTITHFVYDDENRVIKIYDEGNDDEYEEMEYADHSFYINEYYQAKIFAIEEFGQGFVYLSTFMYAFEGDNLLYAKKLEYSDGRVSRKNYYEGSVENTELVGYTVIDNRDIDKNNKKTKETVYDSTDNKLYHAEFIIEQGGEPGDYNYYISGTNWYNADGAPISEDEITHDWVFILIR